MEICCSTANSRCAEKKRCVVRGEVSVELTAKEFALLEHLIERRGRCCSRGELLRTVFHLPEDASTNVVEVYINYLRRKLASGTLAGSPLLIETVRGSGYRIAPSLSRARGATANLGKPSNSRLSVAKRFAGVPDSSSRK